MYLDWLQTPSPQKGGCDIYPSSSCVPPGMKVPTACCPGYTCLQGKKASSVQEKKQRWGRGSGNYQLQLGGWTQRFWSQRQITQLLECLLCSPKVRLQALVSKYILTWWLFPTSKTVTWVLVTFFSYLDQLVSCFFGCLLSFCLKHLLKHTSYFSSLFCTNPLMTSHLSKNITQHYPLAHGSFSNLIPCNSSAVPSALATQALLASNLSLSFSFIWV